MRRLILSLALLFFSNSVLGMQCVDFTKSPRVPRTLGHLAPFESQLYDAILTTTARFPQTLVVSTLATWSFAVSYPRAFEVGLRGFSDRDVQLVIDTKYRVHGAVDRGVERSEDLGIIKSPEDRLEQEKRNARRLLVLNFESMDWVAAMLRDFLVLVNGEPVISPKFQAEFDLHMHPLKLFDPLRRGRVGEILSRDTSEGVLMFREISRRIHRRIMSHENAWFYEPWRQRLAARVRQFPLEHREFIAENRGDNQVIHQRYQEFISPVLREIDPFLTDLVHGILKEYVPTATREDATRIFVPWVYHRSIKGNAK